MPEIVSVAESPDGARAFSHNDPAQVLRSLPLERFREFHQGRRILIIDDLMPTARRLGDELSVLYDHVETETDPEIALARIEAAEQKGTPYDAIVLDLFMPTMTGIELLKRLKDNPPAIVLNTASMMFHSVADVSLQMNRYSLEFRPDLYTQFAAGRQDVNLPAVAIFSHHKLEGLSTLVDRIDGAMLVRSLHPNDIRNFLHHFDPTLQEIAFSQEAVHLVCEYTHEMAAQLGREIAWLRSEGNFEATDWWKRNGAEVVRAFSELAEVHFDSAYLETPALTRNKLHQICNLISQLTPPLPDGLGGGSDQLHPDINRHLEQWNSIILEFRDKVFAIYDQFRRYHDGQLDVENLITTLEPNSIMYWPESQTQDKPCVQDPERIVRSFITEVINAFQERIRQGSTFTYTVVASFVTENSSVDSIHQKRLDAIKCGDYFKITLSDTGCTRNHDQDFAHLAPAISEFQRRKLGYLTFSPGENSSHITLYVKATERKEKEKLETGDTTERVQVIDGGFTTQTFFGPMNVHEAQGSAGNVVAVGSLPNTAIPGQAPVFYQFENEYICGLRGSSHYESATAIAAYMAYTLRTRGENSQANYWESLDGIREVYRQSVRARALNRGKFIIEGTGQLNELWAIDVLRDLGVTSEKIKWDRSAFGPRSL